MFIETSWILKGSNLSVCIPGSSQPSLSAVRRVQRGEWSTVNHHCYSTDYTARPSICLPPSLTLPPLYQVAQIILSPDMCLYSSLGPPTPVLSLSLSLSDLQIPSHAVSGWDAYDCYLSSCTRKGTCQESGKERGKKCIEGFGKKTVSSVVVLEIEKFNRPLHSHSSTPPDSPRRTQGLFPAEIDLHSLICLLFQQLSCCWEEGGGCSPTGWHGPMSSCSW